MTVDAHRFPALGDPLANDFSQAREEAPVFKPLFSVGSPVFALKAAEHLAVSDPDALTVQANAQEAQKGLQEGMEDGRMEGEHLARKEVAPDVANFLEARIQLSNQIGQLAVETSSQAVKLSLAITQAILGTDIQLNENFMAPLLSTLRHTLRAGYHVTLQLPSGDISVLNDLVQAGGSKGLDALPGVTIVADARLADGCLRMDPAGFDSQAVVEQTLAELTRLLENLPPADQ